MPNAWLLFFSLRKDTLNVTWCCYIIKMLPPGFAHTVIFWMFFKSRLEIAQKIMHTLYSRPKTSLVLSLLFGVIKVVLVGWMIISLSLEGVLSPVSAPCPHRTAPLARSARFSGDRERECSFHKNTFSSKLLTTLFTHDNSTEGILWNSLLTKAAMLNKKINCVTHNNTHKHITLATK